MRTALRTAVGAGALLALATFAFPAGAADPERTTDGTPETRMEITAASVADAVQAWIEQDRTLHGGATLLRDPVTGETLTLALQTVHRELLQQMEGGTYFTCAEFQGADGHAYDVDFVLKPEPKSPYQGLWPVEVAVHAVDGKARYSWKEDNGLYTKEP